jgi:hypothetical protein
MTASDCRTEAALEASVLVTRGEVVFLRFVSNVDLPFQLVDRIEAFCERQVAFQAEA